MAEQNHACWADMVKSIENSKRTLPWDPSKTQPVERVSLYERKREERKFNPVNMQFTNNDSESSYQKKKTERLNNISRTTLDHKKKTWDIIGHQGPARKYEYMCKPSTSANHRSYNLLNGLDNKDHDKTAFLYNEEQVLYKVRNRKVHYPKVTVDKNRDFSIITNQYTNKDEAAKKEKADYNSIRDHALKRYWESHDFNPLLGRYYDDDKEKMYKEQGNILRDVQGAALLSKIPPSVLYSEGMSYNILDNTVYDQERLVATRTVANLALNRMKALSVEDRVKKERQIKHEKDLMRASKRPHFKRWETQIDRGYDVINNADSNNSYNPAPPRPMTMWARMHDGGSGYTAPGAVEIGPPISTRNLAGNQIGTQSPKLSETSADGLQFSQLQKSQSSPALDQTNMESFSSSRGFQKECDVGSPMSQNNRSSATNLSSYSRQDDKSRSLTGTGNLSRRAATAIPSLDLSAAATGEAVKYTEPRGSNPGTAVPMVRTGGLSMYSNKS